MKSPIAYVGGKSRLAKEIIARIPTNHQTYVEAFSGAGWVFFSKTPSKIECINDLDSDLVAFYRVVQSHLEEFLKQFKWLLTSREWFGDWKDQIKARGLTDIQRAARYYYIQRQAYAGKVRGRTYGLQVERRPKINLLRIEEEMSEVHLRLSNVWIENLPALELFKRWDKPGSFFFCDPPYYRLPYYKHNMERADYIQLSEVLGNLKGRFLMTLNDCHEMRDVFKDFNIDTVHLTYTANNSGPHKKVSELIITNY